MSTFRLPTVSVGRVDTESPASYQAGVARVLEYLGGLKAFISAGQRVLIKPDLMLDYPGNGTQTTDPEFVAAVGRLARECGAEISIGDSPFVLRGDIDEFWERTGMSQVARRDGFRLVNFEMVGSHAVPIDTTVYYISKAVFEADLIINLPLLKHDPWVGLAGGVRNLLGTVPGFQKGRLFKNASNGKELARILVDIYSAVRPGLTLMQAPLINGAGENGNGQDCCVAASPDAVAVDSVMTNALNLESQKIHTTRMAGDAGLGIAWMEGINIEGEPLENLRPLLRLGRNGGRSAVLSSIARGMVEPFVWMKSAVDEELCGGCGVCIDSCPTNALRFTDGSKMPSINYGLCINCWAGMSNCPTQAIQLTESRMVGRLFPAGSKKGSKSKLLLV